MALSNVIKNLCDGTLTIEDGTTPTALSVVVPFEEGNFTLSGVKATLRETAPYTTRGCDLTTLRHTNRTFPTGSWTSRFAEFSETTSGTVFDMVHGTTGTPYAARVTTAPSGDVITFDLTLDIEGTDLGDANDHQLILRDCELAWDFAEGDPDSISFTFTVYGDIDGDLSIVSNP